MKEAVSQELYNHEYYEKYNHGYTLFQQGGYLLPSLKIELDKIDFSNKKVLDVGCGRGEFIRYALERGASTVVGIDYSEAAIDICKNFLNKYLPPKEIDRVQVLQMDAKDLDFKKESFDVIVMLDIVEHLHNWELEKCLESVNGVIKTDGMFVVHTSPNFLMMEFVRILTRLFRVVLKSSEFHVNEQSYFSMKKNFSRYFDYTLILIKEKHYWENQMDNRGRILKTLSKIIDIVVDFPPIHLLMSLAPFNILFCTDIWLKGRKIKSR